MDGLSFTSHDCDSKQQWWKQWEQNLQTRLIIICCCRSSARHRHRRHRFTCLFLFQLNVVPYWIWWKNKTFDIVCDSILTCIDVRARCADVSAGHPKIVCFQLPILLYALETRYAGSNRSIGSTSCRPIWLHYNSIYFLWCAVSLQCVSGGANGRTIYCHLNMSDAINDHKCN